MKGNYCEAHDSIQLYFCLGFVAFNLDPPSGGTSSPFTEELWPFFRVGARNATPLPSLDLSFPGTGGAPERAERLAEPTKTWGG